MYYQFKKVNLYAIFTTRRHCRVFFVSGNMFFGGAWILF